MSPEIQAFATGFPIAAAHTAVTLLVWGGGLGLYARLSPFAEVRRARQGDEGARITLAGAAVGLALPLAVSLSASASVLEIILWGLGLTMAQLALFRGADLVVQSLGAGSGGVSGAVLGAAMRLSTAMLLSAAVAG